jgi:hypothetical protein
MQNAGHLSLGYMWIDPSLSQRVVELEISLPLLPQKCRRLGEMFPTDAHVCKYYKLYISHGSRSVRIAGKELA